MWSLLRAGSCGCWGPVQDRPGPSPGGKGEGGLKGPRVSGPRASPGGAGSGWQWAPARTAHPCPRLAKFRDQGVFQSITRWPRVIQAQKPGPRAHLSPCRGPSLAIRFPGRERLPGAASLPGVGRPVCSLRLLGPRSWAATWLLTCSSPPGPPRRTRGQGSPRRKGIYRRLLSVMQLSIGKRQKAPGTMLCACVCVLVCMCTCARTRMGVCPCICSSRRGPGEGAGPVPLRLPGGSIVALGEPDAGSCSQPACV